MTLTNYRLYQNMHSFLQFTGLKCCYGQETQVWTIMDMNIKVLLKSKLFLLRNEYYTVYSIYPILYP